MSEHPKRAALPRGLAFEGNYVVPVQSAPNSFFDDDEIEPDQPEEIGTEDTRAETLRAVVELLADFPPKKAPIGLAALRKVLHYDTRTIREIAGQLRCPPATLHDAVTLIKKRADEIKSGQVLRGKRALFSDKTRIGRA